MVLYSIVWAGDSLNCIYVFSFNRTSSDSLQVLHTALVLAYLSELKADIVVELAELESVYVLKDVLTSLMSYSTKKLPPSLKSSPLVTSDPTMFLSAGERFVFYARFHTTLQSESAICLGTNRVRVAGYRKWCR